MKTLLSLLLLAGMMGCAQCSLGQSSTFVVTDKLNVLRGKQAVEKLAPEEITKLAEARAKVAAAQQELDGVEQTIRLAHGQTTDMLRSMCSLEMTTVSFWGEYALVSKMPTGGCVSW